MELKDVKIGMKVWAFDWKGEPHSNIVKNINNEYHTIDYDRRDSGDSIHRVYPTWEAIKEEYISRRRRTIRKAERDIKIANKEIAEVEQFNK